jgi:RNA polymerase sigma factor (sigma-70 family)
MQLLFGVGTIAGMSDGQLLERFLAGRDEAGEMAFEALVARHGPMVMRVCKNVLDDSHDVHDAFQAVFLVLARRAIAIRDRQSVGSWLYGVAVRVTARARVASIRRRIRDRNTLGAARVIAGDISNRQAASPIERNDRAEVVHQELFQLPDKYRAPVVLCYLEGLTHDEAAARLSWPVGTVRSRLARARDRLRTRLSRRGVSAPASIGPMAHWLRAEPTTSSRLLVTISAAPSEPISRELLKSIGRSVSGQALGRAGAAVSLHSTSALLAQGVLNTMLLKKMLVIACTLLPLGTIAVGGGIFLAQQSQAQNQVSRQTDPTKYSPTAAKTTAPKPPELDPLVKEALKSAQERVDAQKAYYEEGRITLDRFIDACHQLELAGLRAAQTEDERTVIKERYLSILKEIEHREQAELQVGRGTQSDLSEAIQRRIQAETERKTHQDMPSIISRLEDLERQVEQLKKERAGN